MIAAGALLLFALPVAASKPHAHRFRLEAGGAFAAAAAGFSESRSITQFAETGRIDATYASKAGPGFEAGLRGRVWRHLGAGLAASFVRHEGRGSFSASFPHPLYFGRPRPASGAFDGLARRETAVHLDIDVSGARGPLDLRVFAGPTWMSLRSDLLEDVAYAQSYPYDTVTVTRVATRPAQGSAIGFNAGAGVDYRLGGRFAVGLSGRFTRVRTALSPVPGWTVDVTGGGLHAGFGVRLLF